MKTKLTQLLFSLIIISVIFLYKNFNIVLPANQNEENFLTPSISIGISQSSGQLLKNNLSSKDNEKTSQDIIGKENSSNTQISENKTNQEPTKEKNTQKENSISENQKPSFTVKELSAIKYATTSLNIRKGPASSYAKIGEYSYNQAVKVTGDVNENNWVRVEYNNKIGYVSEKYLSSTKLEPFKTFLKEDGNVSLSVIKGYDKQWNMVPLKIRNLLINEGWDIYVTSYNIQDRYYEGPISGSIAGLTIVGAEKIYVSHRNSPLKRQTLLHEVAHAFDCEKGWLSQEQEFYDIYAKEKNTIKDPTAIGDGHHISTAKEYFATVFMLYHYKPSILKSSAPLSYKYMQNIINTL